MPQRVQANTIIDRDGATGKLPTATRGRANWALVIIASPVTPAVGQLVELGAIPVTLGRFESGDLVDGRMSRHHAVAQVASSGNTGVTVRDGGPAGDGWKDSANGTWVNGRMLDPGEELTLSHGETLLTGHTLWMVVKNPKACPEGSLLVGVSESLAHARDEIALVVTQVSVRLKRRERVTQSLLVTGPRGSGKQVVAREAHRLLSEWRAPTKVPFREVSAPSLADGTAAADLYGVVDRYATNVKARSGYFVQAEGGVLLLDEVGDTPMAEQAKLLNLLQERQVTPLGGKEPVPFNCLVVSATNKDLGELCSQEQFRDDLLDRLGRFSVHLAPLDERPEDIPFIANALAQKQGIRGTMQWEAVEALVKRRWAGSVRELDMVIERAIALTNLGDGEITAPIVQKAIEGIERPRRANTSQRIKAVEPSMDTLSGRQRPPREELIERLIAADWNKAEVARSYGKHTRQITRWMNYMNIERPNEH